MSKLETGSEPEHEEFRAGARTGFRLQQFNGWETWDLRIDLFEYIRTEKNEEW
jgi:hypothetical protein